MSLPRRLYAPVVPAQAGGLSRVVKANGAARVSPEAVLTYPVRDLQGDVVEPGGIDWADFEGLYERLVNLEHGPYVGTADVTYKSLPVIGKDGKPDESLGVIALPVGVTTFFDSARDAGRHTLRKFDAAGNVAGVWGADECARYAEQTYPLVADGTLSGVSLEFQPAGPENVAYKSLGRSPNLPRNAYHFFRTRALGYAAACELPVNPVAGYAPASPDVLAKAERALKAIERPGTLDLIRKSLSPLASLLNPPSGRVTVGVSRGTPVTKTKPTPKRVVKADEFEEADAAPMAEPMPDGPVEAPPASDMKPTPAALFQLAQGLMDLCDQADAMGEAGEHVKGLKLLKKHCEALKNMAAKVKADAETVAADVGGGEMADDYETPDEPEAVETDDEGVMVSKSFGGWRPERAVFKKAAPWTAHQLKKAKPAVPAGKAIVDADYLKQLEKIAAREAERNGL